MQSRRWREWPKQDEWTYDDGPMVGPKVDAPRPSISEFPVRASKSVQSEGDRQMMPMTLPRLSVSRGVGHLGPLDWLRDGREKETRDYGSVGACCWAAGNVVLLATEARHIRVGSERRRRQEWPSEGRARPGRSMVQQTISTADTVDGCMRGAPADEHTCSTRTHAAPYAHFSAAERRPRRTSRAKANRCRRWHVS
ncbi:hypothetical protein RJ55_02807 [Drechmeria coniospora]|nr:hypothetical protein RJ55_02807 [Drechmeria coniospora]